VNEPLQVRLDLARQRHRLVTIEGDLHAASLLGHFLQVGGLVKGQLAGFGIGWPFAVKPFVQFTLSVWVVVNTCLPLVRSRTKKWPLRLACASNLRGLPSMTPSISTGVCAASQSCVSCGDTW